jgi:endonuclease YncB( thermonuclease family)
MAKAALSQKIANQPVRCKISGTDRYERSIGTCLVGNLNLNQWLVQSGWAVAYQRYSQAYVAAEQEARRRRLNIWNGEFELPSDYRAGQRNRR